MTRLVPFNKRERGLSAAPGFEDIYNMIDDFFSSDWPFRRSLAFDTFKLDVVDNGNEYLVEAEMPGVNKEDIKIEHSDGKLTISVLKDEEKEEKGKDFLHRERRYGSMIRTIYLEDSKPDGIKAKLDKGLLQITVPKEEKAATSVTIDVD